MGMNITQMPCNPGNYTANNSDTAKKTTATTATA